ncbi:MAG: hypothetical protein H6613_06115 [Ignavibacteriales bacterium]|nr:hypothetical protein [Ignavibacteriales bacterium]
MKIYSGIIFFFISTFSVLIAQTNKELDALQNEYESFNYATVISKAHGLLLDKERFSDETIIEISTLKAESHYAMGELENTRKTFIEILKLNENFELSNISYSPKLVDFFHEVKAEFLDVLKVNEEKYTQQKEVQPAFIDQTQLLTHERNTALAKSLLLPGWGHLSLGDNTKGWILTSAGVAALGSMIYFIVDANNRENDYLSEINSAQIQIKYDEYNKSYKIRNALIATYAAIWIYSQIDILFFSNQLGSENISAHISDNLQLTNQNKITLSFKFTL